MKCLSYSNRFYYKELSEEDANCIKKDLILYNSMLHTAYKKLYLTCFYGVKDAVSLQKQLKARYGTNDYFPLSAIHEARALLKSNIETNQRLKKECTKRIERIKEKIRKENKTLQNWQKQKEQLIQKSKEHETSEADYLYEVQIVNPNIKQLKHRIGLLTFKLNRETDKLNHLNLGVRAACFGSRKNLHHDLEAYRYERRKRMLIPGRRQGKYSNNLFKYHLESGIMVYRGTEKEVHLPIQFYHHADKLERAVRLPHNTAGKAVAYELYDHGEYFIIKAIIEVEPKMIMTKKEEGSIGIDINVDHIAVAHIDRQGNLCKQQILPMKLKGKTRNQRKHEIAETASKIIHECVHTHKPLVMEALDFSDKKQKQRYQPKGLNRMLSEFAYAQITEAIERKAAYEGVEVIKVDPAYTSLIGKLKYVRDKGMSVHQAASYVIARKGIGYKEKILREYRVFVKEKQTQTEKWAAIAEKVGKASIKECQFTAILALFR